MLDLDLLEAIVMTLGLFRLAGHIVYLCSGWAGKQPGQDAIYAVVLTLEQGFDRVVIRITNPAAQTQRVRLANGGGTKTHALNTPGDPYAHSFHVMACR